MKAAFDTSVLVPALTRSHPLHVRAKLWLNGPLTGTFAGVASWHTLCETYSVLTRLPFAPRLSCEKAKTSIDQLRNHLQVIEISERHYELALKRCSSLGIVAEEADVEVFLTFNTRDFERLRTDESPRLIAPSSSDRPESLL